MLLMKLLLSILVIAFLAAVALYALTRSRNMQIWLPAYFRRDWSAPSPPGVTKHLMFCFVDHFEPKWENPSYERECERVRRWRQDYPRLCDGLVDADGKAPIHTFFYPGEEYRPEHLDSLVELCRMGLGEIEIHLHHDADTEQGLKGKLREFIGQLSSRHDAMPMDPATSSPRWSFIHGNWALDNAHPDGEDCGVRDELRILEEEGCYADFTLPAAPSPCQTRSINKIYYAESSPDRSKSHDRGIRVKVGGRESGHLMIIQGPLGFMWSRRKFGIIPRIENSDIRGSSPPSPKRVDSWVRTGIHVQGRPEWIFVKVHTHGAQERDMDTLLGQSMRATFEYLCSAYNDGIEWKLHFVSAREAFNIIKAAESGASGDPGSYRDFVIPPAAYKANAGS